MVVYSLKVKNTSSYYKLIGVCFALFFLLLIVLLVGLGSGILAGKLLTGIGVGVLFGVPSLLYLFKRKQAADAVTVVLDESNMKISWPDRELLVNYEQIKSYSADRVEGDESDDIESVRIRLHDGKKIRLYATSATGDISSMGQFRQDFDVLAVKLGLKRKFWSW